jgi:AcrR family transcriptional regulator
MARRTPARRSTTRTPRTGRRPGPSETREAILRAGRELFAEHGYEGTTIRAVAAAAGVDPALVIHYFQTKAGLFIASVEFPYDPQTEVPWLFAQGRRHVGERLARLFVETWDSQGLRNPIITLLRSATTEPAAAALMRDFMRVELFTPLMERFDVDHPLLRADLVASQLLGLGLARYVIRFEPLASADAESVIACVAPTLQRYFTGKLPELVSP